MSHFSTVVQFSFHQILAGLYALHTYGADCYIFYQIFIKLDSNDDLDIKHKAVFDVKRCWVLWLLIWVWAVCSGLSRQIFLVNMVNSVSCLVYFFVFDQIPAILSSYPYIFDCCKFFNYSIKSR